MKKTITHLIWCWLSLSICHAQEVISSQGSTFSTNEAIISFTMGEAIVESYINDIAIMTQGFQQPLTEKKITSSTTSELSSLANIYPNPTSGILRLQVAHFDLLHYQVHDLTGRLITSTFLSNQLTLIDITNLKEGVYQLSLIDDQNNRINRYLITKK